MFKWFKKKEKDMSTTSTADSRTTRQLKKEIKTQNDEISKLRGRVGELVDEMSTLKSEIHTFRNRITSDMKILFENTKRIK
jgi:predicted RNase H-like nuclease (RuvC/YqgF family)